MNVSICPACSTQNEMIDKEAVTKFCGGCYAYYRVTAVHEVANIDPINAPAHYKTGGIETIDFIEAKGLTFHLGNVVKYVARADHKGRKLEDLKKAQWYLNREISRLEEKEEKKE